MNQNQNQRYEARMGFPGHEPGYEGSPYGIPRGEYAANQDLQDYEDLQNKEGRHRTRKVGIKSPSYMLRSNNVFHRCGG